MTDFLLGFQRLNDASERVERHGWRYAATAHSGFNSHGQYSAEHRYFTRDGCPNAVELIRHLDGSVSVRLYANHCNTFPN